LNKLLPYAVGAVVVKPPVSISFTETMEAMNGVLAERLHDPWVVPNLPLRSAMLMAELERWTDMRARLLIMFSDSWKRRAGSFRDPAKLGLCLIRDEMRVDVPVWAQLMRVGEHVYVDL
jgi:hypothetical protein